MAFFVGVTPTLGDGVKARWHAFRLGKPEGVKPISYRHKPHPKEGMALALSPMLTSQVSVRQALESTSGHRKP